MSSVKEVLRLKYLGQLSIRNKAVRETIRGSIIHRINPRGELSQRCLRKVEAIVSEPWLSF